MLFKGKQSFKDLQTERESLLQELNHKAFLLNLNISIIFDAAYQEGGRNRTHFNSLEIVYTAQGESADEYLIDMVAELRNVRQIIIVTNDKILASHLRHYSVKIETVEHFTQWVNRSYIKRLNTPPKEKKTIPIIISPPTIQLRPVLLVSEVNEKTKKKIHESENDYYQRIFEAGYESLQQLEKSKKRPEKKKRKSKVILDPFDSPRVIKNESTEMERWLKAFEENSENR